MFSSDKMNILIIPDKFKFTFSSENICKIVKNSLQRYKNANITQISISDGGEGFLNAIKNSTNLKRISHLSSNPLGSKIKTHFLLKNNIAFLEYAKTGGLNLINPNKRNPMYTNSYGLGQQISKAISLGAKKIIIGIGGSASNDGGIGMASALGFKFLDCLGNEIIPTGANLINIDNIIFPDNYHKLLNIEFIAATDVENFLFGENGAAYCFAEQKGASSNEIEILNSGLINLSKLVSKCFNKPFINTKGDGAAGGLAYGMRCFLNGKIISGSEFIFGLYDIEEKIKRADLIITGEGKLDIQSFNGKLVGNIYKLTTKYSKRLIIISGISEIKEAPKNAEIYPVFENPVEIKTAKRQTPKRIKKIIKTIFK